ncbi:MAG: pyridoxamine 5'-phosphate oxidase family protein [Gallionella sp.]|nr:pyridoxamine 5'-phosphate oxidase family protein [Gallionella sp.]
MSNATEARCLLRAHRYGALCTLSKKLDGYPFGSITPYLVDHDGSLLIYISALAEHTRNIENDPRVSLITHNQRDPNIQMQGRVTVAGNAHRLIDQQQPAARYLRHFPEAADLMMLDFAFYRIEPVAIRYIGGVGRIHWVNMEAYLATQAAIFARHEEAYILEINAHQRDTVHRLLQQVHGVEESDAQVVSLDCDGLDVRCGNRAFRLDFADTTTDPIQLKSLSSLSFHLP